MMRARFKGGVSRHAGKAAFAAATAMSVSPTFANATFALSSPVAGLNTLPVRSEWLVWDLPSIQWPIVMFSSLSWLRSFPLAVQTGSWPDEEGCARPSLGSGRAQSLSVHVNQQAHFFGIFN